MEIDAATLAANLDNPAWRLANLYKIITKGTAERGGGVKSVVVPRRGTRRQASMRVSRELGPQMGRVYFDSARTWSSSPMTSARSATSALMIWLGVPDGVMSAGFGGSVGTGQGTCTGTGTFTICV